MMWFLLMVLISALILFAMITAGSKPRGRHGRRTSSGWGNGRGGGSSHRPPTPTMDRSAIATRWITIEAMAATGGGNGLRQAVSEADKLMDQGLRQSGMPGDTMGERLKAAKSRFSSYGIYDGIWRAHKLRNALAHEVAFDLVPSQAKEALHDFERGLKDLGVL